MANPSPRKAIIIGLSGCSSSGKTTIARQLRDIFPNTFILHEDDFYKPETEIPTKDGVLDWDCAEALSIPDIVSALEHIRETGTFPPTLASKEDQNAIGPNPIPAATTTHLKTLISSPSSPLLPLLNPNPIHPPIKIFILDGFLLYTPALSPILPLLDVKLLLLATHAAAKQRREARTGYVTMEGFWADPPGYVDRVVWPNYVASHGFLFEGGDVEGLVDGGVVGGLGLDVVPRKRDGEGNGKGDLDLDGVLRWAVGVLMEKLPGIIGLETGEG